MNIKKGKLKTICSVCGKYNFTHQMYNAYWDNRLKICHRSPCIDYDAGIFGLTDTMVKILGITNDKELDDYLESIGRHI